MRARVRPTSAQLKAMDFEINRQIASNEEKWNRGYEAMIAWTLHKYLGFGKKRLERFRDQYVKEYENMRKRFEMDETFPIEEKLTQMGYEFYFKD